MTDAPPPIETPPPATPPAAAPPVVSGPAARSPWLLVGAVVAALLVGFILARGVYGPAPDTGGNSSVAAGPTGLPSPDAMPTVAPAPAPAGDPLAPTPTLPSPAVAGPGLPTPDMLAKAKVFLAQPEQASAVQRMLRVRAAGTPGNCAQLTFVPRDVLISSAPAPLFDASGRMVQGMVRQRFVGMGCPGMSSRYNIWVMASGAGAPVNTVAGYMGDTRADPALLRDATPLAITAAQRALPGCGGFSVIDTRVPPGTAEYGTTPWREYWLLLGCGKMVQTTLYFTPNLLRGGTDLMVPSTAAKVVTL